MDRSWIESNDRFSLVYDNGLDSFIEFALRNKEHSTKIHCPCVRCQNRYLQSPVELKQHCQMWGFTKWYKNWTLHGESFIPREAESSGRDKFHTVVQGDDMIGMINDACGINDIENEENVPEDLKEILKLLDEANVELYPGCKKFTSLSFIMRVLHLKVLNGWSNKSVDMLLELLVDAFGDIDAKIPTNYYEASKVTKVLQMECKVWDACPNNCMLYKGVDESLTSCEVCHEPRYKKEGSTIARKRMRYFPLSPRLRRLFMSEKTAGLMRWHEEERVKDGVYRHPADSMAWRVFDETHTSFSSDCRNVRLGLASDGFSPFSNMHIPHSTWPVVLIPYNLPPWLSMKQPYFILSTLIDGPKSPGNKIDVFLQPLIEELKELWEYGVVTYDAKTKQMFRLRAAIMWTISDFPAYGNLSGYSVHNDRACPICGINCLSYRLPNGGKYCFLYHRRFLEPSHRLRRDRVSFYGGIELRERPKRFTGIELLHQLQGCLTEYKKEDLIVRARTDYEKKFGITTYNWKKKSIFWELPYWATNVMRHNLDPMHIEKNFADNILYTILGDSQSSKDTLKARQDLEVMNIRKTLHPILRPSGSGYILPPAPYTMSRNEVQVFLTVLKNLRVPDGYCSNISRRVNLTRRTMVGLKSHDSHVLLQQLIPLAARTTLPKNVVQLLIEIASCFRQLCSKVNKASTLEQLQDRFALTLCLLEKTFVPNFFDIMEHLPIHLAEDAMIAGPTQPRWMWPIERYLKSLKKYVRNYARPEGSIATGYLMEECMNFVSRYLDDVESKENRPSRYDDGDSHMGKPVGKAIDVIFDRITLIQAHKWVLANSDVLTSYRE